MEKGSKPLLAKVELARVLRVGIVRHAAGLPEELSEKWYGQQAVYRVSMGNFVSGLNVLCYATAASNAINPACMAMLTSLLTPAQIVVLQLFFGLLSLVLVGVKFKSDKRDQYLQHGGWFVKVGLWLGFNIIAFLAPVGLVNAYCEPLFLRPLPLQDTLATSIIDQYAHRQHLAHVCVGRLIGGAICVSLSCTLSNDIALAATAFCGTQIHAI